MEAYESYELYPQNRNEYEKMQPWAKEQYDSIVMVAAKRNHEIAVAERRVRDLAGEDLGEMRKVHTAKLQAIINDASSTFHQKLIAEWEIAYMND